MNAATPVASKQMTQVEENDYKTFSLSAGVPGVKWLFGLFIFRIRWVAVQRDD